LRKSEKTVFVALSVLGRLWPSGLSSGVTFRRFEQKQNAVDERQQAAQGKVMKP
jgi:hypothetical protein